MKLTDLDERVAKRLVEEIGHSLEDAEFMQQSDEGLLRFCDPSTSTGSQNKLESFNSETVWVSYLLLVFLCNQDRSFAPRKNLMF